MTIAQPQLTNQVIMVRPVDFGFNEQTGVDNEFQHKPEASQQQYITAKALNEFDKCVETLLSKAINPLILGKPNTQNKVPDAVFPNNWFSTRGNGELIIYPMKTTNRQDEVQIPALSESLLASGFKISQTIDLREQWGQQDILEGTGSLIFHHPSNRLFAARSERCLDKALIRFAEEFSYQLVAFDTSTANGMSVYHTNVLMSCGENFAVIAEPVIHSRDKAQVMHQLSETVDDLILISEQQMSQHFCGNVLQLKDAKDQPVIVMSNSAIKGFSASQKKLLERHGDFAIFDIPTIESVGGGSARCMIAENFLPKL